MRRRHSCHDFFKRPPDDLDEFGVELGHELTPGCSMLCPGALQREPKRRGCCTGLPLLKDTHRVESRRLWDDTLPVLRSVDPRRDEKVVGQRLTEYRAVKRDLDLVALRILDRPLLQL